jgi:hypothetical protein
VLLDIKGYLSRCGLLVVVGALSLSGSGDLGPSVKAGLRPGDTGWGWMSDPDACPLPPSDPKSDGFYSGPGYFAGGFPQEYCDDAAAKSQAAEVSLHYFAQELAQRGDPRWLFLEPLFGPIRTRQSEWAQMRAIEKEIALEKTTWLGEAVRSAPKDALIAWAAAEDCSELESCDGVDMARHLVDLEPDNGAAHLMLVHAFLLRHDEIAARQEFTAAALAKYYRAPQQGLMQRMFATLQAWDPPQPQLSSSAAARTCLADWPDCAVMHRYTLVMSPDDMHHSGPYNAGNWVCEPRNVLTTDPSLRADCVRVYTAMARNDYSQWGQQEAFSYLIRLTDGQPDNAHWRESQREYQWITKKAWLMRANEVGLKASLAAERLFYDDWVRSGLVAALRASLVRHHISTTPPANWQP